MTPLQRNRLAFALIGAKLAESHLGRIKAIMIEYGLNRFETDRALYKIVDGELVVTFE